MLAVGHRIANVGFRAECSASDLVISEFRHPNNGIKS